MYAPNYFCPQFWVVWLTMNWNWNQFSVITIKILIHFALMSIYFEKESLVNLIDERLWTHSDVSITADLRISLEVSWFQWLVWTSVTHHVYTLLAVDCSHWLPWFFHCGWVDPTFYQLPDSCWTPTYPCSFHIWSLIDPHCQPSSSCLLVCFCFWFWVQLYLFLCFSF